MISIAATFVAEPLQEPMEWLLQEAGIADSLQFAPYHQIFQELLSPTSGLRSAAAGDIGVVLLRLQDFVRDVPEASRALEVLGQIPQELGDAFEQFTAAGANSLLLMVLPPGPELPADIAREIRNQGDVLQARLASLPRLQILDAQQAFALTGATWDDPVRDRLGHVPYTDEFYAALALLLVRRIHALRTVAAKVLVLDCDNTLWRGVVGEEGVNGIGLDPGYLALQDFAVGQQARGVLICLCSKNVEADVFEVLDGRADMRLRREHLVSNRINWDPKAANIQSLAAELNLGLDAFVFLDDNPVECAYVQSVLPQVVTLQVPGPEEIPAFLGRLWNFDKLVVTREDATRTEMYRQNAARRAVESSSADIGQFLAALDLRIDVAEPAEDEWGRVGQLTQRTNQFNFTTRRRSDSDLKSLQASGYQVLRVRVSDRFGDYGLVGVLVAQPQAGRLQVDTFLLSCRVLGRGVEHAMLRALGTLAVRLGLAEVVLDFIATAKNIPARAFADSIVSEWAVEQDGARVYRIPAALAAEVAHRPGHDPAEVMEALRSEEKKAVAAAPGPTSADRSSRYSRIASVLVSGRAVLAQLQGRPRLLDMPERTPAAAATDTERKLLEIWTEVLGVEGLGVEDRFFDVGGTSLLSVKLFAEIERQFAVQLRLTAILDAPTIRALAGLIESDGSNARDGVVCLRPGNGQNLFLVHDGLGETLLYANLARRMPASLAVYGIEPRRLPGVPLAHARIEDMAEYYVGQIRRIQPRGPYLLGGMCAGGVIAYQMAVCLEQQGEQVAKVVILDGATPQAAKRGGRITRGRLHRLNELLSGGGEGRMTWTAITAGVARRLLRTIGYEISSRGTRASVKFRFAVLQRRLRHGTAWPELLPGMSVMQIYNELESRYQPLPLSKSKVLLVRATQGEGNDTPYRDVYRDPDFGWSSVARQLEIVDVQGGHSSMLQEHAVDSLKAEVLSRLPVPAL